jgi:hypothetical protein
MEQTAGLLSAILHLGVNLSSPISAAWLQIVAERPHPVKFADVAAP